MDILGSGAVPPVGSGAESLVKGQKLRTCPCNNTKFIYNPLSGTHRVACRNVHLTFHLFVLIYFLSG